MASLLRWRPAKRGDRTTLQNFSCTEEGGKRRHAGRWEPYHPRPWELSVQSSLRRINPPAQTPDFCLTGWDGDALAAVAFYDELDGPGTIEIRAVAVGCEYRRQGGGYADEMLRIVLDDVTLRALEHGVDFVTVHAHIDESNRPSQRLFRRVGMQQTGVLAETSLQIWAAVYQVSGADLPGDH